LTLASLIKRASPRTHVTVGGTMMSALYGKNFDPRFFRILDSILFFEGEEPFLGLLKALEKGGDPGQVPNLIVSRNGKVIATAVEPATAEVDSLPTPDFDGLPINRYLSPEPILPLASSRGCYWRQCAFCTRQHLLDTYRKRSVHKVLQDLQTLQAKYGCQAFFFVDECISPAMLNALADEILARRIDIRWSCYVRFERQFLDKGFCKKLAQSGLRMLYFGLESACQRILDLMKKGTEKEAMQRILESTSQAGIMSMILYFVGFPTETREEALESMEFILRNQDHIRYALAGQFMLEEHSPIFQHPKSFGIRLGNHLQLSDGHRDVGT
jgi:anaerobic magnesium-protoporphyrin IX monomethyl ester cyclase